MLDSDAGGESDRAWASSLAKAGSPVEPVLVARATQPECLREELELGPQVVPEPLQAVEPDSPQVQTQSSPALGRPPVVYSTT